GAKSLAKSKYPPSCADVAKCQPSVCVRIDPKRHARPRHVMAGLDLAIQDHAIGARILLLWMAASEGGHDVVGTNTRIGSTRIVIGCVASRLCRGIAAGRILAHSEAVSILRLRRVLRWIPG